MPSDSFSSTLQVVSSLKLGSAALEGTRKDPSTTATTNCIIRAIGNRCLSGNCLLTSFSLEPQTRLLAHPGCTYAHLCFQSAQASYICRFQPMVKRPFSTSPTVKCNPESSPPAGKTPLIRVVVLQVPAVLA